MPDEGSLKKAPDGLGPNFVGYFMPLGDYSLHLRDPN